MAPCVAERSEEESPWTHRSPVLAIVRRKSGNPQNLPHDGSARPKARLSHAYGGHAHDGSPSLIEVVVLTCPGHVPGIAGEDDRAYLTLHFFVEFPQ